MQNQLRLFEIKRKLVWVLSTQLLFTIVYTLKISVRFAEALKLYLFIYFIDTDKLGLKVPSLY